MKSILKNKKGQERSSTLGWIIGIAAVIIIILFVYGFYNYLNKPINNLPGSLTYFAESCVISAKANLGISYCKEFKEVDLPGLGKKYINCQYPDAESQVKKTVSSPPTCDTNEGVNFCRNSMSNPDFDKTKKISIYNLESKKFFDCPGVNCSVVGGKWGDSCPDGYDFTSKVTDLVELNDNVNKKCCGE